MNMMKINGYDATVVYDDEIEMFRGEFIGLNGGADFYGASVEDLRREGEVSLRVFLDACKAKGIDPQKAYSGKFQMRVTPELHARAAAAAAGRQMSLNQYVVNAMEMAVAPLEPPKVRKGKLVYWSVKNGSDETVKPRVIHLGRTSAKTGLIDEVIVALTEKPLTGIGKLYQDQVITIKDDSDDLKAYLISPTSPYANR